MYGTADHEAWLIEMEALEDGLPPDAPWTMDGCGCAVSMIYGGDCAHTVAIEFRDGPGSGPDLDTCGDCDHPADGHDLRGTTSDSVAYGCDTCNTTDGPCAAGTGD